jgi:hypothetical protein
MAFFRIKKIKNKQGKIYSYAYLVENKWKGSKKTGKQAKQKVKAYLGKVFKFSQVNEKEFNSYHQIEDTSNYLKQREMRGIVRDLIEWEIHKHDIHPSFFNADNFKINYKGKDVAIKINEGYMCNHTLSKLINFKINEDEEVGYSLAKVFVDAGINVPKELFVKIFEKITN